MNGPYISVQSGMNLLTFHVVGTAMVVARLTLIVVFLLLLSSHIFFTEIVPHPQVLANRLKPTAGGACLAAASRDVRCLAAAARDVQRRCMGYEA